MPRRWGWLSEARFDEPAKQGVQAGEFGGCRSEHPRRQDLSGLPQQEKPLLHALRLRDQKGPRHSPALTAQIPAWVGGERLEFATRVPTLDVGGSGGLGAADGRSHLAAPRDSDPLDYFSGG